MAVRHSGRRDRNGNAAVGKGSSLKRAENDHDTDRRHIGKKRKRETERDCRVIHLFQEGSFYRAYERSAWLCVKHVNPQMKVTRKALKGGDESFCFVGFPVTSLPKYSPDSAETRYTGEKEVDILLPGQGQRREYARRKIWLQMWNADFDSTRSQRNERKVEKWHLVKNKKPKFWI